MNGLKRRVHFVGVGGIGMSGLAEILLNLGYPVSGSDLKSSEITERLKTLGLTFFEGHAAHHVGDAGIVVRSAAVDEENVEIVAAKRRGIPVLHRSEMLADLMRLKPNAVAVGGTHGKTTTTSMISAILDHADIGATSIVGGILHRSGTNARWGEGDYLVAEADEHDGSFLHLSPTISVVTNIDAEHLEYYGTVDRIKQAFIDFCNRVPFYGYSIVCIDDPNTRSILPDISSVCITYGLDAKASLSATNIELLQSSGDQQPQPLSLPEMRTRFELISHDERLGVTGHLGTVTIKAVGVHNVRNALAACAVGLCLGMPPTQIIEGIKLYDGVRRRLQVCGTHNGVTVVEDYAHHPSEIAAVLDAVECLKPHRIICVFQPHLYSRTKFFFEEFAQVLRRADMAIVTDIYPARESPMPGVHAGLIVDAARKHEANHVELIKDMYDVPRQIASQLERGDIVLILGAGNINRIAPTLLEEIRSKHDARGV